LIYLDNAATTKPSETAKNAALEAMECFGNPSSLHRLGLDAEKIIKKSREAVAGVLGVPAGDIYFTSGGTEANNLAILGYCRANQRRGKHIITSKIEHPSVLAPMEQLEKEGFSVDRIGVDADGVFSLEEFSQKLCEDTIFVSVMAVNNEVGTVQPIAKIRELMKKKAPNAILHVDAVQAFGKIVLKPKQWGVELMSVSAHKIHGLTGCGALYVGGVRLNPLQLGGGQQKDLRSGTENVPGIAAFGAAAGAVTPESDEIFQTRTALKQGFSEQIERVVFHGSDTEQSGYLLNVSFLGVKAEVLLHTLEAKGIYVSGGSACSSHKPMPSHVLTAMGCKKEEIDSAIRFSFSQPLTDAEIELVVKTVCDSVSELRRFMR